MIKVALRQKARLFEETTSCETATRVALAEELEKKAIELDESACKDEYEKMQLVVEYLRKNKTAIVRHTDDICTGYYMYYRGANVKTVPYYTIVEVDESRPWMIISRYSMESVAYLNAAGMNGYMVDELKIAPKYWGFFQLTDEQFQAILKKGEVDESVIIN